MDDSKAASNRKCRFKLRLHFDTKVGRYRITKYNGSHSNHQLGKVQVHDPHYSFNIYYEGQVQVHEKIQNSTKEYRLQKTLKDPK